jgi:hypothetical protein
MPASQFVGSETLKASNSLKIVVLAQLERRPNATGAHATVGTSRADDSGNDTKWRNQAAWRNHVCVEHQIRDSAATLTVRAVKLSDGVFDNLHAVRVVG